jgi:hypothetical protein
MSSELCVLCARKKKALGTTKGFQMTFNISLILKVWSGLEQGWKE